MHARDRLVHELREGLESAHQLGELLRGLRILEGDDLRQHCLHAIHVVDCGEEVQAVIVLLDGD
jgi:hypothetical protein